MRQLSNEQIEELSNRPGVDKAVVQQYLSIIHNFRTSLQAILNLMKDSQDHGWNKATVLAILDGIKLSDKLN